MKRDAIIPSPRVSVRNSERYPIKPRVGISYSIRTDLEPEFSTVTSSPLRLASFSMMIPWCSSGTSIINCSTGSSKRP